MKDRGAPGFPNGWYSVGWSKDLGVGDVQRIRYFDNEMVLFRTRSGKARVLDAYCAHIGAHLAEGGRVEIRGLCSFYVKDYKAYTGRNPKTKEAVSVAPKKLPFFKCGKELKERVDR